MPGDGTVPPAAPAPAPGAAELRDAERALASLRSKLEKVVPKLAPGTAQRTLAERRVRALALALDLVRRALAEGERCGWREDLDRNEGGIVD